jgi:hypothetical protein
MDFNESIGVGSGKIFGVNNRRKMENTLFF